MSSSPESPGDGDAGPTARLWARVERPDPVAAVEALLGITHSGARQMVGGVLATSAEAEDLLDRMPRIIRSLAISTTVRARRCYGEIRGPVLWSETMAARASSAGDAGLFVCLAPEKAHDTLENQVLVAALTAVREAGTAADLHADAGHEDDLLRRARFNTNRALRSLDHRALATVTRTRPDGRALRRARSGHRRRVYAPALALLARATDPVAGGYLAGFADQRTAAQHQLVLDLAAALVSRTGEPTPPVRVRAGALVSGPIHYFHARVRGTTDYLHGVVLDDRVLVDVPPADTPPHAPRDHVESLLTQRSGGRPVVAYLEPADVDRALTLAGL